MKAYFKQLCKSLPLAIGVVMSLICIAFVVKMVDGDGEDIFAALFFGLIGFPLLITGLIRLPKRAEEGV